MKKLNYYFEKVLYFFKHWIDYLPITNIVLFGLIIVGIAIAVVLVLFPVTDLKIDDFDNKNLKSSDKLALVLQKQTFPDINKFDAVEVSNPFRPSRTDWVSKTVTQKQSKDIVREREREISIAEEKKRKKNEEAKKEAKNKRKPKIKAESIKLSAIIVFGIIRVALIENVDKANRKEKFVYVKVGDDIGGYTVKSIEREKLIVEWNGEETVINLYKS